MKKYTISIRQESNLMPLISEFANIEEAIEWASHFTQWTEFTLRNQELPSFPGLYMYVNPYDDEASDEWGGIDGILGWREYSKIELITETIKTFDLIQRNSEKQDSKLCNT